MTGTQFLSQGRWLLIPGHLEPHTDPARPGLSAKELVSEGDDNCFLHQEKLRPEYLEQIPEKMKLFSDFLGKKQWFVGDKVKWKEFAIVILFRLQNF